MIHGQQNDPVAGEDELGDPISWRVLEPHTPVYARGGAAVGVVRRVMALEEQDIFDGLVVHTHDGDRFVPGEQVAVIREHAVALALDEAAVAALDPPKPGPAAMSVDGDTLTSRHLRSVRSLLGDAWNRLNGR